MCICSLIPLKLERPTKDREKNKRCPQNCCENFYCIRQTKELQREYMRKKTVVFKEKEREKIKARLHERFVERSTSNAIFSQSVIYVIFQLKKKYNSVVILFYFNFAWRHFNANSKEKKKD